MTIYLTDDEMRERLRIAAEAAERRRAYRAELRAEFAAARAVGLRYRHAAKLARGRHLPASTEDTSSPRSPSPG